MRNKIVITITSFGQDSKKPLSIWTRIGTGPIPQMQQVLDVTTEILSLKKAIK